MAEKKKQDNIKKRNKRLLNRAKKCLYNNKFSFNGDELIIPSKYTYKGVWNWDSMFIALAIAKWDKKLAISQIKYFTDRQCQNGMLLDAVLFNGKIYDTISKPPVIAWVLYEILNRYGDCFDLGAFYEILVKNVGFWEKYRLKGELFGYDAFCNDEYYLQQCKNESGWDNSVRWDEGAEHIWAIDLNCFMIFTYRVLSDFANRLGFSDDGLKWKDKAKNFSDRVNNLLWDEKTGCYCDFNFVKNKFTEVLSPASFFPLFINIATKERAEKMKNIAESEKTFYPLFPTVSYNNELYSSFDYWRGPTWLNVMYFALVGLKNYGYNELCEKFRENILNVCANEKKGIFEYYDSKNGKGLGAKQFSWSAVFIIELINF